MSYATTQRRNTKMALELLLQKFGGMDGYVGLLHQDLKAITDASQAPDATRGDRRLSLDAHRMVKNMMLDVDRGEHDDARMVMDHNEAIGVVLHEVLQQIDSNPQLREKLGRALAASDPGLMLELTQHIIVSGDQHRLTEATLPEVADAQDAAE